ncbi:MAG: RNA polymerase sigma-70 factor [Bacteroides sp.]|jgi:RNA polymerase sigma-70 factor (ECF subfamily)|nr:RNA polymerase sigma-70 factor [Bacteroides sp.]MCI1681296.1 RNA polymerase sigma-70 factor [Bacteroides sp.]
MSDEFDIIYKSLFHKYYSNLLFYATRIVGEEEAEDLVQEVFVDLWHRKNTMILGGELRAFLYRAVYTRSLNVLKHRRVKNSYEATMMEIDKKRIEYYQQDGNDVVKRIENKELRMEILEAINELPTKCKMVFKLKYLHDMKNKDIAETMGVSSRTVEAHMYNALKFLRERLKYLNLLLVFWGGSMVNVFVAGLML